MPTNHRLKDTNLADAGLQTRMLLETWGILHMGRTALGVASVAIFLWASTR